MTTLIKKPEAAQKLGVSVRTLEKMIARGVLPAYKVGPRLVRLKAEDIEAYINSHQAVPKVEKAPAARPCRYYPGMKVV